VLPWDVATPIANNLAGLSGYFLIVPCAIFLEKYLLAITASATFRALFPKRGENRRRGYGFVRFCDTVSVNKRKGGE